MHIMPGVLIIEALAQVGADRHLVRSRNTAGRTRCSPASKDAKFRRKVIPGDRLTLDVVITRIKSKFGVGLGKAFVDGELACEAEFSFVIYRMISFRAGIADAGRFCKRLRFTFRIGGIEYNRNEVNCMNRSDL
ncbi:MAG: hypothetical protein MZU97_05085 [Bacillus subtilis]|nr:hypothetical protein [Bacillus subtilis]